MSLENAKGHKEPCLACGGEMTFGIGSPNSIGRETKDEERGISNDLDQNEKLRERSRRHFQEHELPRLIEKEGKDFAIRQGWINEDGTIKK